MKNLSITGLLRRLRTLVGFVFVFWITSCGQNTQVERNRQTVPAQSNSQNPLPELTAPSTNTEPMESNPTSFLDMEEIEQILRNLVEVLLIDETGPLSEAITHIGSLIRENALAIDQLSQRRLVCVTATTGWLPFQNNETYETQCPRGFTATNCLAHYYDTNGGVQYHGFTRGKLDPTRTTCSLTIGDGGISEGEVFADCCQF